MSKKVIVTIPFNTAASDEDLLRVIKGAVDMGDRGAEYGKDHTTQISWEVKEEYGDYKHSSMTVIAPDNITRPVMGWAQTIPVGAEGQPR